MTTSNAWRKLTRGDETRLDYSITQQITSDIYGSRYQFLADAALQRISDTNYYYRYYDLDGQYWTMPHSLGYRPTIMPINLARKLVRTRAAWMFEDAPDIECPPKSIDKADEMETIGYVPSEAQKAADEQASAREQFLYSTWDQNRFPEKLMEAGRDFFIGGTVALKLRYLPGRGIRLNFSPCQEVFPIPNADDPDLFDAVHFCSFFDNDKTIWKQTWELLTGTDGRTMCYLTEGYYDTELRPLNGVLKYTREPTGLDFIPVLIFPRDCLTKGIYGTSYLKDLIPLFTQYSKSLSDAADSLRFNLFSVVVMLNAAPGAENQLKVSPGEIWNIGGDSPDVKKLESSFSYSAALADFLNRLESLIHLLGDIPDIRPDNIKGFGLVSGVALKLLYSDLVSATQQDWRVWKSRLVQCNEYILRMAETFKVYDSNGDYANRIIPHLPLPENEAEKVAIEGQKLATSMQSVHGALQELGDKYPERTIAKIITEREKFLPAAGKQLSPQEQAIISGA